MIEFNTVIQMFTPPIPEKDTKLSSFLLENLKGLAGDLYQNPDHLTLYQQIKDLKNEPLIVNVKKIELCAAIHKFNRGEVDLSKSDQIFKVWQQLKDAKQLTPEMDKLLSYLLARALEIHNVKEIEPVRAIIARNLSECHEKGMALAAWVNNNAIILALHKLTAAELALAAPYLHYVNCLGLAHSLNFLSSCTNAYRLVINSDRITELKELPPLLEHLQVTCRNLTTLFVQSAPYLQIVDCCSEALTDVTLLDVPQLRTLGCMFCPALKTLTLPRAPQLQWLQLKDSGLRTLSLPHIPRLKLLDCNDCKLLSTLTLPYAPLLEDLECRDTSITELSLPYAPRLRSLDCYQSSFLTRIAFPNALNLTTLKCAGCVRLTTLAIQFAPSLVYMMCGGSFELTTIEAEALPSCSQIDCANCQIERFPQLPPTATVYGNGRGGGFNSFRVNPLELALFPRKVLLDLGKLLLADQPMPNIVWLNPLTNRPAEGIDAGGLRRQFITTLCDNLFTEGSLFPFTDKLGGKLPLLEKGEEDLALRTFARLIALCSTSTLLLGEHLPHSFFYAVRSCLDQQMEEKQLYLTLLGLWDPEFSAEENYAHHSEELENPLPVTLPIAIVANELKSIPRYSPDQLRHDPLRFIESVKGTAVTKEALLAKMRFEGMREYFEQFTEEHPHKLTDLVELFTSCRTLGEQPITIRVFARDPQLLPLIHTCSQEVEMPLYPSYDVFREKLNLAFSALKTFENA